MTQQRYVINRKLNIVDQMIRSEIFLKSVEFDECCPILKNPKIISKKR